MNREDILQTMRNYPVGIETNDEKFRILCEAILCNGLTFRKVGEVHLCENTLWIGELISIDVDDVKDFKILQPLCYRDNVRMKFQIKEEPR